MIASSIGELSGGVDRCRIGLSRIHYGFAGHPVNLGGAVRRLSGSTADLDALPRYPAFVAVEAHDGPILRDMKNDGDSAGSSVVKTVDGLHAADFDRPRLPDAGRERCGLARIDATEISSLTAVYTGVARHVVANDYRGWLSRRVSDKDLERAIRLAILLARY